MEWPSAVQQKPRNRYWFAALHAVFAILIGSEVIMAQTQSPAEISVTCTGGETVSAQTLALLCSGLHLALAEQHPNARFVLHDSVPEGAKAFVVLQAFTASKANIDAQLNWQAAGSAPVMGARTGFSITDKDLTPALQQKFLSRLVKDTALPF